MPRKIIPKTKENNTSNNKFTQNCQNYKKLLFFNTMKSVKTPQLYWKEITGHGPSFPHISHLNERQGGCKTSKPNSHSH